MKQIAVPFLTWLAKALSGATARWVDCEPCTCQRIYFANHTSHLDALVLWASLPRNIRSVTRPVAAADYWQGGPVRRYMASIFNVLLIDRMKVKVHNSPIDMMLREILAKKRPDIELIPVYIDNLNRVMPKGEFLPVPLLSCITIGAPIWLEAGETKNVFLARARETVGKLREA